MRSRTARGSLHGELDIARLAVTAAGAPHPELRRPSSPALGRRLSSSGGWAGQVRGVHRISQVPDLARAHDGDPEFRRLRRFDSAVSLILVVAAATALADMGVGAAEMAILAALGAMSAIDVAVALVNRMVTLFVRAVALPGLALLDGMPADAAHDRRDADNADAREGNRGAG